MQGSEQYKNDGAADVRWRVTTAAGIPFACVVHVANTGIEVRLTTRHDQLVCVRTVSSLDAAGEVVHGWLRGVVAEDGLSELFPRSEIVH